MKHSNTTGYTNTLMEMPPKAKYLTSLHFDLIIGWESIRQSKTDSSNALNGQTNLILA